MHSFNPLFCKITCTVRFQNILFAILMVEYQIYLPINYHYNLGISKLFGQSDKASQKFIENFFTFYRADSTKHDEQSFYNIQYRPGFQKFK